jgi:hypothetical protein
MKAKRLTNTEMLRLKAGTKVRIKPEATKSEIYRKGGVLVFQSEWGRESDERKFGILVQGYGVCFDFSCNDYILIEETNSP